jgi:hypothetical protein
MWRGQRMQASEQVKDRKCGLPDARLDVETPRHCMTAPLHLKHLQPLAKGNVRLVFEHPSNPALLVKVMRPDHVESRYGGGAAWFRRGRRFEHYLLFVREIREYVATYAAAGHAVLFAQQVCGLVETDLGLGLVTEAALGSDGKLAPTLAKLVQIGQFDPEAEEALERFFVDLLGSVLVISDLHERNVVYACGRDGKRRFVMIDGLGSSTILPFKNWSGWLNRRSKVKRIARLRLRIAGRVAAYLAGNPRP